MELTTTLLILVGVSVFLIGAAFSFLFGIKIIRKPKERGVLNMDWIGFLIGLILGITLTISIAAVLVIPRMEEVKMTLEKARTTIIHLTNKVGND